MRINEYSNLNRDTKVSIYPYVDLSSFRLKSGGKIARGYNKALPSCKSNVCRECTSTYLPITRFDVVVNRHRLWFTQSFTFHVRTNIRDMKRPAGLCQSSDGYECVKFYLHFPSTQHIPRYWSVILQNFSSLNASRLSIAFKVTGEQLFPFNNVLVKADACTCMVHEVVQFNCCVNLL
jgi:hypothetical protein